MSIKSILSALCVFFSSAALGAVMTKAIPSHPFDCTFGVFPFEVTLLTSHFETNTGCATGGDHTIERRKAGTADSWAYFDHLGGSGNKCTGQTFAMERLNSYEYRAVYTDTAGGQYVTNTVTVFIAAECSCTIGGGHGGGF